MHRRPVHRLVGMLLTLAWPPLCAVAQQTLTSAGVFKDGSGSVIGPIVGFNGVLQYPILRIVDPDANVPVFVSVRNGKYLRGPVITTYFSEPGCAGVAYHDPAASGDADLLAASTGYTYSTADITGTGQWLIRSDVTDAGSMTDYQSSAIFQACSAANAGALILRVAIPVLHIHAVYPPDYTVD